MSQQFCYSMDGGEYFTGRFETREEALDAALQNCEGYHSEVHTAAIKDWPEFIETKRVGMWVEGFMNDYLDDEMSPIDYVLQLEGAQYSDLGQLVVNWFRSNANPRWYGTEDVQAHDVEQEINR